MASITLDYAAPLSVPLTAARCGISLQKIILFAHAALTILFGGWLLLYPAFQLDPEPMVYPVCVVVSAGFVWILWSWYQLRRTLFEPYPLFILVAGLFNAGQAVLEVLGMNPNGILGGRVPPEILVGALNQVTFSMALLHGGALAALATRNERNDARRTSSGRERATRLAG